MDVWNLTSKLFHWRPKYVYGLVVETGYAIYCLYTQIVVPFDLGKIPLFRCLFIYLCIYLLVYLKWTSTDNIDTMIAASDCWTCVYS